MKPENQRVDIEALKRQLRQEFDSRTREIVQASLNEVLFSDSSDPDPDSDDDQSEDLSTEDDDNDSDPNETKPFISVKFRNNNKIFTVPTELNSFGDILVASDGTSNINVIGKIFDDQDGIESYKIRIKRID